MGLPDCSWLLTLTRRARARSDLLSGSRTARLTRALVQTGRAYSASAVSGYPADKHACAMLLCAAPCLLLPAPPGLCFLQ
jgi:predicted Zn-dependent peptidase